MLIRFLNSGKLNRSIQADLIVAFIAVTVLSVTIVSLYFYGVTLSFIQDRVALYTSELLRQNARQLEILVSQPSIAQKQITSYLVSDEVTAYYEMNAPVGKVAIVKKTEAYLKDLRRSFPASMQIYIKFDNGDFYTTNSGVDRDALVAQPWMVGPLAQEKYQAIFPAHTATYANSALGAQNSAVVTFVKLITVVEHPKVTAIIQIDLDYSEIQSILAQPDAREGIQFSLLSPTGDIIYGSAQSLASSLHIMDGNYLTTDRSSHDSGSALNGNVSATMSVGNSGWRLEARINQASLYSSLDTSRQTWLGIVVITLIIAMTISYFLSISITSPIRKLVKNMRNIGDGHFEPVVVNSGNSDIRVLCNSYNLMIDRISALMKNVVEKETEKTTAQLKALEAQINPHFLYNTLETMRSIAVQNGVAVIADICKALADMFRYSVGPNSDFVTLGVEIRHVQNYMSIQEKRFGDKISFDCLIDDKIYNCKTIKLFLQPIVENAVYHGIEMKRGKGQIIISAYDENNVLIINVADDGVGIAPSTVERLNAVFKGSVVASQSDYNVHGIGLLNVDHRIKLHYGYSYGLHIYSTLGKETLVQVRIPLTL